MHRLNLPRIFCVKYLSFLPSSFPIHVQCAILYSYTQMSTILSAGDIKERTEKTSGMESEPCDIPVPVTAVETVITTHGDDQEEEVRRSMLSCPILLF